jgi:hypothetical protein
MKAFTLYVGTELDRDHAKIDTSERNDHLAEVKAMLADKFGGYSMDEVKGGYRASDGKLAEESAVRIELTAGDEAVAAVQDVARKVRDLFRQESVLLNVASVESSFV